MLTNKNPLPYTTEYKYYTKIKIIPTSRIYNQRFYKSNYGAIIFNQSQCELYETHMYRSLVLINFFITWTRFTT